MSLNHQLELADQFADEIVRLLRQPNPIDLPEDVRVQMAVYLAFEKYRDALARASEGVT